MLVFSTPRLGASAGQHGLSEAFRRTLLRRDQTPRVCPSSANCDSADLFAVCAFLPHLPRLRHPGQWLQLVCLLAWPAPLRADRTADDEAAAGFFAGPILRWEIALAEPALDALRRDPRSYVRGQLQAGDQQSMEVGLHLKGSAGSKRPVDDKPSWTVDIDRFHAGQTLFGETKFHLNNAVQDSTYLNQNLASRVYRAAGIPATRSTHALVTLNGRDLGVYVVVETYDNRYLRRAFPQEGRRPGNLYEGAFVGDIDRELQRDGGYGPADHADQSRLRQATEVDPRRSGAVPSSKGVLERAGG